MAIGRILLPDYSRGSIGTGRPYPASVVAAVRGLIEETGLPIKEAAERTGLDVTTIARWSRRHRWRGPAGGATRPNPATPARLPQRGTPYGPAAQEAARGLIEGKSLSLDQIELRLGITSRTLFRWCKRFRWNRPAKPGASGLQYPRYRRRGRPYATDAVEEARRLVTTSRLSTAQIATQIFVSPQTVWLWIRRRGWVRPPVRRGDPGYPAARRVAALAAASVTGRRLGRGYSPDVVAEARILVETTELPTALMAARLAVSVSTLTRWAKRGGWTRPSAMPDAHGRLARRRRRRRWS